MTLEDERTQLMYQIQRNMAELSILNDGIRNPLAIIETILEVDPEGGRDEIQSLITRIDAVINQLDRRWLSLRRYSVICRNTIDSADNPYFFAHH